MQLLTVFPFELAAASLTIHFWNEELNGAIFITIFWVAIVFINLAGVKGYGEAEFVFSFIKVIAVVGFIILGIVMMQVEVQVGLNMERRIGMIQGVSTMDLKEFVPSSLLLPLPLQGQNYRVSQLLKRYSQHSQDIMLTAGQPSNDITKSNETSHLANHNILHGLPNNNRLSSTIHRTPSFKQRILNRHQSIPLRNRNSKRRNTNHAINHECSNPHLCPFRGKFSYLRRNANSPGPR
jgi:hypothetical protein